MKFINLNDIEEIVLTKYTIEKKLLKEGKIKERQPLNSFIIDMTSKNHYILKIENKLITFGFYPTEDEIYIFVTEDNEENQNEISSFLKRHNYNLNNLIPLNTIEISNNNIENVVIHNSQYYKI